MSAKEAVIECMTRAGRLGDEGSLAVQAFAQWLAAECAHEGTCLGPEDMIARMRQIAPSTGDRAAELDEIERLARGIEASSAELKEAALEALRAIGAAT
jgi:hypothetical protein